MARSTSIAAQKAVPPSLRERAYNVLLGITTGLTADEIAEELGLSVLSVRPRVTELANAGRIEDTGDRRPNISGKNAIVWIAG